MQQISSNHHTLGYPEAGMQQTVPIAPAALSVPAVSAAPEAPAVPASPVTSTPATTLPVGQQSQSAVQKNDSKISVRDVAWVVMRGIATTAECLNFVWRKVVVMSSVALGGLIGLVHYARENFGKRTVDSVPAKEVNTMSQQNGLRIDSETSPAVTHNNRPLEDYVSESASRWKKLAESRAFAGSKYSWAQLVGVTLSALSSFLVLGVIGTVILHLPSLALKVEPFISFESEAVESESDQTPLLVQVQENGIVHQNTNQGENVQTNDYRQNPFATHMRSDAGTMQQTLHSQSTVTPSSAEHREDFRQNEPVFVESVPSTSDTTSIPLLNAQQNRESASMTSYDVLCDQKRKLLSDQYGSVATHLPGHNFPTVIPVESIE